MPFIHHQELKHFKAVMIKIVVRKIRSLKRKIKKIIVFCNSFYMYYSLKKNKDILSRRKTSRILIIQLYDIGDTILSTPFFRELRNNLPEAHITLLINSITRNMMELNPYVDEIIICDLFSRSNRRPNIFKLIVFAKRYLWKKNYDLAIILNWIISARLSILAQLCVKPFRVIYHAYYLTRNKKLFYWLSQFMPQDLRFAEHEVEHNLKTLEYMRGEVKSDRVELWVNSEDQSFADELFSNAEIHQKHFIIAFCPGAYYPSHRWPIENYVELAEWLLEKHHNLKILIFGGGGEEYLGEKIRERLKKNAINLIGKTSLRQSLAVLQKCHLYIGNDTGTMHLASAADLPVIDITCHRNSKGFDVEKYPYRYAPWQVAHIIVQPKRNKFPCVYSCKKFSEQHCITEIHLEDVKQAVSNLEKAICTGKSTLVKA
jgi:heptosyltransferase-2